MFPFLKSREIRNLSVSEERCAECICREHQAAVFCEAIPRPELRPAQASANLFKILRHFFQIPKQLWSPCSRDSDLRAPQGNYSPHKHFTMRSGEGKHFSSAFLFWPTRWVLSPANRNLCTMTFPFSRRPVSHPCGTTLDRTRSVLPGTQNYFLKDLRDFPQLPSALDLEIPGPSEQAGLQTHGVQKVDDAFAMPAPTTNSGYASQGA